MKSELTPKFNHDKDELQDSLGIDMYRAASLHAAVIFHMIANRSLAEDLYDNIDEAPNNFKTTTGVFEKVIEHTDDFQEFVWISMMFSTLFEETHKGMKIEAHMEQELKKIAKKEEGVLKGVINIGGPKEHKLSYKEMKSFIKSTGYNYDAFLEELYPFATFEEDMKSKEEENEIKNHIGNALKDFLKQLFDKKKGKDQKEEGEE